MRPTPDAQDLKRLLELVGLEADPQALEALQRRMDFYQSAMDRLDAMDLGMTDPATAYHPDEGEY